MTRPRQAKLVSPSNVSWRQALNDRIPLFGHRNWIVVADSAYPAQSRAGIETFLSNAGHLEVLEGVLSGIAGSMHIRPIVYTDKELEFVEEADAPGISVYRKQLSGLLQEHPVEIRPHEQIISMLDQAGQIFRVLIIKTNMVIPYTSVYLQVDCRYWCADAERRLRGAMGNGIH